MNAMRARSCSPRRAAIFDLHAAESSVGLAVDRFATALGQPVDEVRPLVTFVRDCITRALLVPD